MERRVSLNRLRLVDMTLGTMALAGYDLDGEDVAFIWKTANGTASQAEIDDWTSAMAERLANRPPHPDTHQRLNAMVRDIGVDLGQLRRDIQKLIACEEEDGDDRSC